VGGGAYVKKRGAGSVGEKARVSENALAKVSADLDAEQG
jgi:hypothetical protein